MAKSVDNTVLDAALNVLKTTATKMVACNAQPTTFTEANATFKLAEVAVATGDFTIANGDVSGRKVTVAAKAAVPVATTGTVNHVALITATTLLYVTTTTAQGVSSGGTVDIGTWKAEIQAPT